MTSPLPRLLRTRGPLIALAAAAVFAASPVTAAAERAATPKPASEAARPLVFAHRGASGHRPEHTLAAYQLAIRMGADAIEPDLVPTKDGVLVSRHENEISGTTDIADHPEFADRTATKTIDGVTLTGWFTEDFTLAELKMLRAKERLPDLRQHNTAYDHRYQIPTLEEVIDFVRSESEAAGRQIMIVPEVKHSSYFARIGLPIEGRLVRVLQRRTTDFIESGDPRTYADMVTPAGLRDIAAYADWLAPEKPKSSHGVPATC